jgi:hypothetical protein
VGRHSPASVAAPTGLANGRASFSTASAVGYLVPSVRDFEQNHRRRKPNEIARTTQRIYELAR